MTLSKCLVLGCDETSRLKGEYLCPKCFVTITTGHIKNDDHTFLGDLQHELLVAAAMIDKLAMVSPKAVDGGIALDSNGLDSNGLDSNDLDSNDPAVLDDDEPPGKPERRLRRYYPPVYPKFQNPTDPAETWSGRGKTPRWLATELKKGKTINDFVINRVVLAFPQRKGKGQ
jgi:H-NS histone family